MASRKKHEVERRPEGWSKIDSRCKPSKAVATDAWKPALQHGFIRHDKDGSWLCLTDSFLMVRLPIDVPAKSLRERRKLLPERALIPEALKSLDRSKTGWFSIEDGLARIHGDRALYPLAEEDIQPPDFAKLLAEAASANGGPTEDIGLNPDLLRRIAEATGAKRRALHLKFHGSLKPVEIDPMGGVGDALVMPIRVNL